MSADRRPASLMSSEAAFQLRVEQAFNRIAELPPAERAAALDAECGDDPRLREEVASLLAADGGGTFIVDLVSQEAEAVAATLESSWIGRRVGVWRITGILGRGGMGAVYEVSRDDGAFRQRAALKLIRAEVDSDVGRRRFLEERQILAHLNHPNIARLLDGGEAGGAPYLVMEAVDGVPITEHCARTNATLEQRLRLFTTVCRAVHFAHTQLIVHRDLKPSNILVTDDGTVKLLDFGIAKLLAPGAADTRTLLGEVALTPDYASPEQVRSETVTTATDVYSLGAVLYELLSSRKAHQFDTYTLPEISRVICDAPVEAPSESAPPRIAKRLAGDLDNITLMALRKEPTRRYASAEKLAEDVERHLDGRPVTARADSWRYRTGKFIGRNRLAVAAATLVILSLVAGIIGTLWQARRAERRFEQVRSLANTFLFRFHDEIRDLPGSTAARELLVSTALEYLDNLSKETRDPQLQFELGAAYEKVGDVQGNPRNSNLGRMEDAVASYEKSLQLRLTASDDEVDTPAEARAVLQSHLKLADVLIALGRTAEAERHAGEGKKLAAQYGSPGDRLDAFSREGELAMRRGDLVAAEVANRKALDIALALAKQKPGTESTAVVARCAALLGDTLKVASKQQACLDTLDLALAETKKLLAADPDNTAYMRQIMNIHNDRGDALRSPFAAEGMFPRRSLAEYTESLRIANWLAQADPSEFSARFNVGLGESQVSDSWREIDPRIGMEYYARLMPRLERMVAENPANFQSEWLTSLMWFAYASTMRDAGELRGSLPLYDRAAQRIARMRETDRGRRISRRDVVKVHLERGGVRLALGDVAGAATDAQTCRTYAAELVKGKLRPIDLRDVALCNGVAADVAMRQGKARDAVALYDESLLRWRELGARNFDSPYMREQRTSVEQRRTAALAEIR